MRGIWVAGILACVTAAIVGADNHGGHVYKKAASVHDLMEYMVGPAMDKIKAYREAGGPSGKDEWKKAFGAITMVNEASQLVLMDGRVKDDAWRDGASQVIAASKDAMMGAYRMDADGYTKGLKAMSAGCKTCHDIHKKKE
jgi:cytochrome c556